ncbi:MAG: transporter [Burkholderiales bacterium]
MPKFPDLVAAVLNALHLRFPGRLGHCVAVALASALVVGVPVSVQAQDMEPRAYSNAPVGLNFLIAGYAYTSGGYPLDGALPITNPQLATNSAVLAYGRVLDLWGKSAKLNVIVPYTGLGGTADLGGQAMQRDITGFADPAVKLSVNLYGAPALSLKEFAAYEQDLIIGVSLRVTAPFGQYDDTKAVNLSTNRWTFKPEVGVSKALGPWTLEATAAATLYTDNTDFFNGNSRTQRPLYSFEAHTIYSFTPGIWGSLDLTYFTGGRTTINGTLNNDLQQNWRLGGTLSFPVNVHNSVKLYASSGVSARTGNSFDLFGIAWQYRWGAGL